LFSLRPLWLIILVLPASISNFDRFIVAPQEVGEIIAINRAKNNENPSPPRLRRDANTGV
jgi:hypothetical protein